MLLKKSWTCRSLNQEVQFFLWKVQWGKLVQSSSKIIRSDHVHMLRRIRTVIPKRFLSMTGEILLFIQQSLILKEAGQQVSTVNPDHLMQAWVHPNLYLQYFINFNFKYDPMNQRNLLNIPDFIPCHPNNSRNIQIGDRHKKDNKHYLTNYGNSNSFVHESRRLPSNNPAINAFRNKWMKSRL